MSERHLKDQIMPAEAPAASDVTHAIVHASEDAQSRGSGLELRGITQMTSAEAGMAFRCADQLGRSVTFHGLKTLTDELQNVLASYDGTIAFPDIEKLTVQKALDLKGHSGIRVLSGLQELSMEVWEALELDGDDGADVRYPEVLQTMLRIRNEQRIMDFVDALDQ